MNQSQSSISGSNQTHGHSLPTPEQASETEMLFFVASDLKRICSSLLEAATLTKAMLQKCNDSDFIISAEETLAVSRVTSYSPEDLYLRLYSIGCHANDLQRIVKYPLLNEASIHHGMDSHQVDSIL